ncbi:MAG: hypothetical protein ACJA0Q_000943 [Saprospiraceae bacterium]|jgi:hypothetical protein
MNLSEALVAILTSTFKLMVAPILLAGSDKFPLIEIALYCALGGLISAVTFFFIGKQVSKIGSKSKKKKKAKKIFTKKNIQIIKIKNKFGLYGMAMLIGVISVPLGALLVGRYFGKNKLAVPALIGAAFVWSFAMTYSTALVVRTLIPLFS